MFVSDALSQCTSCSLLLCMGWHPWLRRQVLVGVVEFLLNPGGLLMVAVIGGDSGTSVLFIFIEWTCPFISDASVSMVETVLACNW